MQRGYSTNITAEDMFHVIASLPVTRNGSLRAFASSVHNKTRLDAQKKRKKMIQN